MKFYLDTEFIESGYGEPIWPLSVGIATEGNELYVEIRQPQHVLDQANAFVRRNVLPHLDGRQVDAYRAALTIKSFVDGQRGEAEPELWAYYADYDWVVVCQLFGRMVNLPEGWPMYCRDLKQEIDRLRVEPEHLASRTHTEHHALGDAIWVRDAHLALLAHERGL